MPTTTNNPVNLFGRAMATLPGKLLVGAFFWTAVAFVFALPGFAPGNGGWRRTMLGSLAQWWSWGLLAPWIAAADRWLPLSNKQLPKRLAAHLFFSLIFTSAYVYVQAAMQALLGDGPWSALASGSLYVRSLRGMFLWSWLIYWLILGAWQTFQYYERFVSTELRMERLERSFAEARLNSLRMQLDPHFLFNALNTISSQVERDPRLARGMIGHLGDLLRLSLESRNRQEVPLAEEMAFLEHYLAIQKIRFGDHLRIERFIAPDVQHASVPSLMIQPLVENAIRHGISCRASLGTVTVSAQRQGSRLQVCVLDDGVGLPDEWAMEQSQGLGLSLTRARIAELHPNGSSNFAVRRRAGGGTEVEISLPFRVLEQDAHASGAA